MKSLTIRLVLPATVGFLAVLPFVLLEWINKGFSTYGFSGALFGFLWALGFVFTGLALNIHRNTSDRRYLIRPGSFLLSAAFLLLVAVVWGGVVLDQMPCFMGVPNCD